MSIETNPNHLQPDTLARYRDAGVTRLSVGVQSFDDGLLAGMDRLEKYGDGDLIRERLATAHGIFPTLNVDMIFNLPGQSLDLLDADLSALLALDVDQVSFYPLMTAPTARHKMEKIYNIKDALARLQASESEARDALWAIARGQEPPLPAGAFEDPFAAGTPLQNILDAAGISF
jgi:coproporphyrinogen III oxidase-like Fe-S oxidoreductase